MGTAKRIDPARALLRRQGMLLKVGLGIALAACVPGVGRLSAQPQFGALTGLLLDKSQRPVAGATVTSCAAGMAVVHSTISGSDGVYSFGDMLAGVYSVVAEAPGYVEVSLPDVRITAKRAARADLVLAAAVETASSAASSNVSPASAVRSPGGRVPSFGLQASATKPGDSIWKRWLKGEQITRQDLQSPAPLLSSVRSIPSGPVVLPPVPGHGDQGPLSPSSLTPPPAPAVPTLPEALQAPDSPSGVDNFTPFAYGDFTWLNGNPRTKTPALDTKFFTPEVRFDTHFMEDFNQPVDHSMGGSTESFRSGEVQVEQISVGGDFHWQNVRGRILTMFGLFATTTPRNDASAGVGQWDLRDAYRYVSEAYGGYHFNVNHGLNVDAGIFVSYIGLFSYYNFDNWAYQPSFVFPLTRHGFLMACGFNGSLRTS